MAVRIKYPFVYIFAEPNIVFVYEIKGTELLNVDDIRELEKQTYEMAQGEDFSGFNHEHHKPIEGRGYSMSLESHYKMIKEMNKAIHLYKKGSQNLRKPAYTAVHITNSESSAGSLRYMLPHPKKVIGLTGHLGIGPLWKLGTEEGMEYRAAWLFDHINYPLEDFEQDQKFARMLLEIDEIPEGLPIYIWAGENADEQTSLRFIINLLKEKNNELTVINTTSFFTEMELSHDGPVHYTGQIEPENLSLIFERGKDERPLNEKEQSKLIEDWDELARTHAVLRIWQDGKIISVQEDHFDSLIIETLKQLEPDGTDGFVKAGHLIGAAADKGLRDTDLFFLEYRLRELIYTGILELRGVPKSMRHYRVKLRHR